MIDFKYVNPQNLEEGLKILSENSENMTVIAGGSELLNRIRSGKQTPKALLDISAFGLEYINSENEKLIIGAMTKLSAVESSSFLKEQPFTVLTESAGLVGGWQTRNLGTIGGNICTGNSSADMAVSLLALNARLKLVSFNNERIIPVDDFFKGPRIVNLQENEILKELIIDKPNESKGWGGHFIKFGKRKTNCISTINIAAVLKVDITTSEIQNVRIAMGTVANTPIRLYKCEELLKNKKYSEALIDEAINTMRSEISPRTSFRATKEYREEIARVIFKRVLEKSYEKCMEGGLL